MISGILCANLFKSVENRVKQMYSDERRNVSYYNIYQLQFCFLSLSNLMEMTTLRTDARTLIRAQTCIRAHTRTHTNERTHLAIMCALCEDQAAIV